MASIGSYSTTAFSEDKKFLVLDPATQSAALVSGADLVGYITPSLTQVFTETTRAAALTTDYQIGQFVQIAGAAAINDGGNGLYIVVAGGDGDYAMMNGNDLLLLPFGSLAGSNLDGALVTDDGVQVTIQSAIALRPVQYGSMEAVRLSTTSHDYIETTSFYAGGTKGGAKLYRDGTGTPTGSGAAVIAAALAAGTFCNAAGNRYKLRTDQTINAFQFGATADATTDDRLFLQAGIDFCELTAAKLTMYPGVYRITQYIEITAAMSMVAAGIAGPRVYASAAGIYGGPEIFLDASPSDRTLKAAYCLSIDAGTVGAEGYARVRVEGIGFSWNGLVAGGVYVEGAADVVIDDNWFSGGLTNYNLGTQTGFCIYTRDAVQSKITGNNFRYAAYGVVGEEYVNEVVISGNNFDKLVETAVLIRGSASGIRSAVENNNIIDTKYGVVVVGNASSVTIEKNTFEIIRYIPVYVTNTDPISSAVVGVPRDVHTLRNAFIACNISIVGPLIQYIACVGGQIGGNESRSPTGNTNNMLNIGATCTDIVLHGDDYGALTWFSGSYDAVVPLFPLEISFTPVIRFGGASVGITYSAQAALATKIGKSVHVQGQVSLTSKGSSTGIMTIAQLPIAARNTTNLACTVATHASNLAGVSGNVQGYILPAGTSITFSYLGTGAQNNVADTNATNTTSVIFSATYAA